MTVRGKPFQLLVGKPFCAHGHRARLPTGVTVMEPAPTWVKTPLFRTE